MCEYVCEYVYVCVCMSEHILITWSDMCAYVADIRQL